MTFAIAPGGRALSASTRAGLIADATLRKVTLAAGHSVNVATGYFAKNEGSPKLGLRCPLRAVPPYLIWSRMKRFSSRSRSLGEVLADHPNPMCETERAKRWLAANGDTSLAQPLGD